MRGPGRRTERPACAYSLFIVAALLISVRLCIAAPLLEKTILFEEKTNGFVLYRIPGVVVTARGTMLAYCEARRFTVADRGEIEIHLRRSTDNGCMAGLVSHRGTAPMPGPWLLFSNPQTTDRAHRDRRDLTIQLSRDHGRTWPVKRLLQSGPSAYSDLAVPPDGTILCFYESGRAGSDPPNRPWQYACLTMARFDLAWLVNGQNTSN
ncbi:MAG: exo-alpha-sialidase [Phycisphaerales bacterium]|nr:MAG: exo-alpha-sialidase [Phycisphaerales bacterium]